MKRLLVILFSCFISYNLFCQINSDTSSNFCSKDGFKTVRADKSLNGLVVDFCNGLSLDFGETHGVVILKQKDGQLVNILLNPYKHYSFKKGTTASFKVESVLDITGNKYCIPLNGNYIVKLKL